jgi:hypothetical protein
MLPGIYAPRALATKLKRQVSVVHALIRRKRGNWHLRTGYHIQARKAMQMELRDFAGAEILGGKAISMV